MKRRALLVWLGLALGLAAQESGFTPLFNGKDFSGWWGCGTEDPAKWMALSDEALAAKKAKSMDNIKEHWKVVDGMLVSDGKGLYLTTEKNYRDFEFRVEYKHGKGADSGVYLRGIPQVQIWDPKGGHPDAKMGSGGLWNNNKGSKGRDPLVLADSPVGEWNKMFIRMKGDKVTVILNGTTVVAEAPLQNYFNKEGPLPEKGPIQLQTHGAEITWRHPEVRELVDLALSQDADGGFVSIVKARKIAGTPQYGPNLHDFIKSDYLDLLVPDKILVYRIGFTRNEDQTKKPIRAIGNFAIKSIATDHAVSESERNLLSGLKNFDSYGDVPKTVFAPQWAFVFISKDRQLLIVHDPKTRVFVFSELIPDPATGKIWEGSQVMIMNELTEFFNKLILNNEKTYGAFELTP